MGLSLFKKFKRCCQGNSDNYFEKSSYKDESKVSTEDFLKKQDTKTEEVIKEDENDLSNVKFTSSIINDDKISEVKHVEIDEESILSDRNINQLRQRNPRLNKYNNDVIRLSLRKSLYANNLEQDLENFLKEQQRVANRYDRKENPYTISDMRELYDMINNMSIKDKVEDEIIPNTVDENLITDDSEKPTQENDNIISEPNDKLTSEPTEEIAELKDDKKETKIDILNQNSIIPDNNNNNPLKINTNLSNNIPKKDNISSNENKQIEILENDNNSISSLPKDTIKNEPKMLLNQSPELNSFEVVGSLKNDKINNPDQTAKSSIINYSEILCHSQNDKITEQPQSILYNSPQQNYSEIMCNSPEEEESSPHNLLCSSPQTSYSEMLCESPIDEYNNDNHTVVIHLKEHIPK